jgi:hypothetical protein
MFYLSRKKKFTPEDREKKKNPDKQIYKERTIELGILVDNFLWQNMKVKIELDKIGCSYTHFVDMQIHSYNNQEV